MSIVNNIDLHRNLIALLQLGGMGRKKTKTLIEHIHQPENLTFYEIIEVGKEHRFIPDNIGYDVFKKAIATADAVIKSSAKNDVKIISCYDKKYPISMIFEDSPVILYYQGNLELLKNENRVGVVGSRKPSSEGFKFARNIGKFLAEQDFVVISGLATGCDTAGHLGCLKAGGRTLAFLPSGLLNVYPRENHRLAQEILRNDGCLLSEYTQHEEIHPYKFIERDRLQAASSNFLIVSEFSVRSGTIHTLNYAKKYAKKILTSPIIYEKSLGGFQELEKRKIPYEVLEVETLHNLIKNYKNNKSFVFL